MRGLSLRQCKHNGKVIERDSSIVCNQLPPLPVNGESPTIPPPPYKDASDGGGGGGNVSKSPSASAELDNGTKTASTELLSPGSREGELSVPIIALPDGEFGRNARPGRGIHAT